MLKKLFTEFFEKLKKEKENNSTAISGCCKFFVEKILEEQYKKPHYINDRTLVNYYNKFVEGNENGTGEPKAELKNLIANYLGYTNFSDFEKKHQTFSTQIKPTNKKLIVVSSISLIILVLLINKNMLFTSKECIVWQTNHFIKVSCANQKSINNHLYKINIKVFKKINVTDTTTFFINGKNIVWYGKSKNKKMEFFNDRGIHPITLKELKPITERIINKYVFDEKEKTLVE